MYSEHFGFRVNPFSITASPQSCYESSTFKIVCDKLVDNIENIQDIVLLTGEPGVGKTYLLNEFKRRIGSQIHCVYPRVMTDHFEDIVDCLCNEPNSEAPDRGFLGKMKVLTLVKMKLLKEVLSTNNPPNAHTVLIIDDAHCLHEESLKVLSSIATPANEHNGAVHVLFAGLPKLEKKLHRAMPDQTKVAHATIDRLSYPDIYRFIKQHLQIADYHEEGLFTSEAIFRIAAYSNGIPRAIVKLCASALLIASLEEKQSVTAECVSKGLQYCRARPDENYVDAKSSDALERQSTKELTKPSKRFGFLTPLVRGTALAAVMVVVGGLVYQMSGVSSLRNSKHLNVVVPQAPTLKSAIAQSGSGAADSSPDDEITLSVADMASLSNMQSGQWQTPQSVASDPVLSSAGNSGQILAVAFPHLTPSKQSDAALVYSAADPANAAQPGDDARQLISALEEPQRPADLDGLYRQARRLGNDGQSTDAYLLYFYAAKRGHGEAAFKLAQLADPATFKPDIGLRDTPSLAQANKWYQRALAAGHAQARQALTRLHAEVARRAAQGDEPAWRVMLQLDATQKGSVINPKTLLLSSGSYSGAGFGLR